MPNETQKILETLQENPMTKALQQGSESIGNLFPMEEALILASAFKKDQKTRIVVKKNLYEAQQLYNRLAMLEENTLLFPMEESLRVMALASSPEQRQEQLAALATLQDGKPRLIIATTASLLRFLPKKEIFKEACFTLKVDEKMSLSQLKEKLYRAGYAKVNYVDRPGTFASRGGIVDLYSLSAPDPIRIEFFDDEIESIRSFSVETQRTTGNMQQVTIWPATELLFSSEQIEKIRQKTSAELEDQKSKLKQQDFELLQEAVERDLLALETHDSEPKLYPYLGYTDPDSLLDYVDGEIILSSEEQVEQFSKDLIKENMAFRHEMVSSFQALPRYTLFHDLNSLLKNRKTIGFHTFLPVKNPVISNLYPVEKAPANYIPWLENQDEDNTYYALEKEDIHRLADRMDISKMKFIDPIFYEGFSLAPVTVYTRKEIFSKLNRHSPYKKTFAEGKILNDVLELSPGDYVVHSQYGIGQYLGIEPKETIAGKQDYLHIAYRDGEDLYVPLSQFHLVRKYLSKEGTAIRLSKLGSNQWEKTKKKVSERVEEIAGRLVDLYSSRMEDIGFAYPPDGPLEREFDEAFEFESTPDQIKATREIKNEMEKAKPMDHLLCGDVGFGKTEVAMRAAFKAISSGKQVAFLCPTTILSMQHYKTLTERFKTIGSRIALLNRFTTAKEFKEICEGLKDGTIEIVVGTHRLLSKKVDFKDLGLLIIDEEQRFGVEHKEKIKEMRQAVDVLTLSATPIPRTLQMSLIGVRTISTLNTPPANRLPVQTYVMEKKGPVVHEIIERELSRNGQVFYLHNKIEDLDRIVADLQKKFPDHSIAKVHGGMSKEEIEEIMIDFNDGKYQILVCTTIIEIGMDVANANTIIIDQADRYGLSQLYQIRGRVGRRDKLAYCYLLINEGKQLGEKATKRLQSIKEFTQLGSGYKIAMRDLTIRGAGDMLGEKQAGFIDQVGLDLYLELLSEAIARKKGEPIPEKKVYKKAQIKSDGFIPEQFTENDGDKLALYQQMDEIHSFDELLEYQKRTEDLFGRIPREVLSLFKKKKYDLFVNEPGVDSMKEGKDDIQIIMDSDWTNSIDGVRLFEAMNRISPRIRLGLKNSKIEVTVLKKKSELKHLDEVFQTLLNDQYQKKYAN